MKNALSDRSLLRNIQYVRVLDDELSRYGQAPPSFKSSKLGQQVQDVVKFARQQAVKNAGELAMERYQRNLDELDEHLRNGEKILIDITNALRNKLDEKLKGGQVSKADAKIFGVVNQMRSTSSGHSTVSIGATSLASIARSLSPRVGGKKVTHELFTSRSRSGRAAGVAA
ncbi:MAG: hypothetical protein R3B07_34620 [Polyangiaceae bacterium]